MDKEWKVSVYVSETQTDTFKIKAPDLETAQRDAMTEAVEREYDITDTAACSGGPPCFGEIPGGGNPQIPNDIDGEGDGIETGMGDSIIRLFADPGWNLFGGAFLPGAQFTLPTATEDVLGTETFSGGPIFTFVWDVK